MNFEEQRRQWVSNYVALGGSKLHAEKLAARQFPAISDQTKNEELAEQSSNDVVLENSSASVQPTPNSKDFFSDTTRVPVPEVEKSVIITRESSPDLFGDTEKQISKRTKIASTSPAPQRRGRKPAALHEKPPTQKELELFQLSMEIEEKDAIESGDLGFMPSAMILASLPHSKVEGHIFTRKNNNTTLTIMNRPDIGLPYGKIPRVIIAFLCTEAKRNQNTHGPNIFLGNSLKEFIRKLGMIGTGGARGDIGRTADQAKRLFTSNIMLTGEPGTQFHWKKMDITTSGMLLWDPADMNKESSWESTLKLSEEFFNQCKDHSFPFHLQVINELKSPLAIDIYLWLTYRYNSLRTQTHISWLQLQWQFGSNYPNTPQGKSDFKSNFKKQLRNVLAVYRSANVDTDAKQDTLILKPSKPHINPKSIL